MTKCLIPVLYGTGNKLINEHNIYLKHIPIKICFSDIEKHADHDHDTQEKTNKGEIYDLPILIPKERQLLHHCARIGDPSIAQKFG